jgi:hypothetical protein
VRTKNLRHREVDVHPQAVVPGEVAHERAVPRLEIERYGLRRIRRQVAGLAHVRTDLIFVDPIRSPSKLVIGKLAASVSVDTTTNSCGVVPAFDTDKVIAPEGIVVAVGVIDHSWIVTPRRLIP